MNEEHADSGTRAGVTAEFCGLTEVEARVRLERDGPNQLVASSTRGRLKHALGPFADPMVALLLVAAPTYLLIGETVDAVVALVALVPVAGVGWVLERRAERTLERLSELTAPTASTIRDGEVKTIGAVDLVVGDVVVLQEGDVIPADANICEATQLLVDEASLTGESLPIDKTKEDADKPDSDSGSVWAGTTVLTGRATVEITSTGPRTRYGKIGTLLATTTNPATPLQQALSRLVAVLAGAAAVFCVAVMAAELWRGNGWGEAVIAGVSLAIAAIPEEFAIVYALYLSIGAWRLAREDALVRSLPGAETLGSTTVICTDKTGTLTEGRLSVAATANTTSDMTAPSDVGTLNEADAMLLSAGVLACEPDPFDPLDQAITAYAGQHGIDVASLHSAHLETDWPFDPIDKYLTHVWRLPDGAYQVAAKGAYEGIVAHASMSTAAQVTLDEAHALMTEQAMRVVAVASARVPGPTGVRSRDEAELEVVGLIAFNDPIREGVDDALAECAAAGIRVIMITGDHPVTAHAIAEGLGLPHQYNDRDLIATGDDLDNASEEQLDGLVSHANVFARTRPEQKHLIVEALRRQGAVVAMTGDGVNDAPALRAADIGIAMGQRGTPVAREAATLVLLDDNFATIVAATRNGRQIYDNLTRAFAYLIAFHPPLLIAALLVPILGKPLLLLPVHLVILEILLHPIVSLVFQAEPADPDVMTRPPRPAAYALSAAALWRPYAVGITLAAGVTGLYLVGLDQNWSTEQARALGFATLLAAQPLLLLIERRPAAAFWRSSLNVTKELAIAIAAVSLTTAGVLYFPPLATITQLEPFPAAWWTAVVAVAAVTTLWSEPLKTVVPARMRNRRPAHKSSQPDGASPASGSSTAGTINGRHDR